MTTPLLHLERLTAGYGEGTVISDVSLDVNEGSVLCLLGRNGAGKTTLLKTVIGLLRARHGTITFDGHDLTMLPPHARARLGIGYVPQGRQMFPQLTVRDNLMIGFEARAPGRPHALDATLTLFPVLGEMSNRMAGMLSGGQQQQLAIGRALVSHPRLLILDEPTEGIQPSIVQDIKRALLQVREEMGTALLLAEQFLDFATGLADDYSVLDGGMIAFQQRADALDRAAVRDLLAV